MNIKIKIYKTIILPFVLCGCKSWSLTLREEHRLRMLENRVLRRIFEPKEDKVIGEWRKLHNGELHNLYSSPDIIRRRKSKRTRWAGYVAYMEEDSKVYKILVGKPKEKKPLRRLGYRWEDGIRMDLWEVGGGRGWSGFTWLRMGTSGRLS
jgi:hypothetical protein